ncbi:hypothetical protein L0B53_11985 [Vibrio sp. SS-MA-C1-2]|uniref:hypothetical protein n=1 Tax=Vibrio sp. SS-MA-C1-2 TaxID=2908646 RepID=UPI001F353B4C|nr:hypothetical protein [Vibrio sp. SS-MA-C1-2]UJF17749.1 hypothetical protein L0B53_11985 [Vibrio sp. SS-MA-C1-2]
MGIFASVSPNLKKQDVVSIINQLIGDDIILTEERTSHQIANQLVNDVWNDMPDVFQKQSLLTPHNITAIAIALANGVAMLDDNDVNREVMVNSLKRVLNDIELNSQFYTLNQIDVRLLNTSNKIYNDITEK